MPPRKNSRYETSFGIEDDSGNLFLTERKPFRFDEKLPGTRRHRVTASDSLQTLAHRYFKPLPHAEHLWWIIAEFQPDPILDPTLSLETTRILYVPSVRVVQRRVFGVR